jgi:tellurite resistance protein TerC
MDSIASPSLIAGFTVLVLAMLALDLGVFHRRPHEVRIREALIWSVVWIALAFMFAGVVYFMFGSGKSLEFVTGYVIEKALSVDNVFIFVVLFAAFRVPAEYQHRVLFWGVFGALLMRAAFILAGAVLIERFHWILYVFGAILVVTAIKIVLQRNEEAHPERNPIFRLLSRIIPSVPEYDGKRFFTVRNGRRYATPMLMVLLAIESTDLVFAVDSIPAIFAVTDDPFIVYTSNVFAILGLRALYFVLAGTIEKFRYVKFGLAGVLAFVGVKMMIAGVYKIPIAISLAVIALLLGISVAASMLRGSKSSSEVRVIQRGS